MPILNREPESGYVVVQCAVRAGTEEAHAPAAASEAAALTAAPRPGARARARKGAGSATGAVSAETGVVPRSPDQTIIIHVGM